MRIGQEGSRNRRAVKVWDKREFRDYDTDRELGVRNAKMALRRLRRFARDGAPEVLDLDGTIRSTARNAGWLDIKMVPKLHNAVKVLLFLDVGGSMDDHVQRVEELFSAAKSEFKNLEHFYFHNCVYESVWKDNRRRQSRISTVEVMRKYGHDYKLILVGDAAMSPYELEQAGRQRRALERRARAACGWSACCAPGRTPRGSIPSPRTTGAGPRPRRTCSGSWTGACFPSRSPGSRRR